MLIFKTPIKEDFEKPLKTTEFAPEVYKGQGVSGGKSKSSKIKILQIISRLFDYIGLISLFRFFNEKISKKEEVIILMYHRIFDTQNYKTDLDIDYLITPKDFERQIEYISKNYNAISFDTFIEHVKGKTKLPRNSVIITFDDGYKDCYVTAYPILKKYKVPAMFFLATNYINSNELYWWDKVAYSINTTDISHFSVPELGSYSLRNSIQRLKVKRDICKKLRKMSDEKKNKIINELVQILKVECDNKVTKNLFLTWAEVKEMSNNGMDFGAHTCSHVLLTKVPFKQAKYEITESKSIIQNHINKNVIFFSYPSGTLNDFNESIKKCVKNSGFIAATSTIHGINKISNADFYSLKRIDISADTDIHLFKLELTGILEHVYGIHKKLRRRD